MNTARVQEAARLIAEREEALIWLTEHGLGLTGRDKSEAGVSVHLNYAGACRGAKQAAELLSSYARVSLPDIVTAAIACCHNDIAIHKDTIRAELEDKPDA